jgi:vacuolar-type H+-ATPase subunit I/STV1
MDNPMVDAQLQRIEVMLSEVSQVGARHEKWLESIDSRFKTLNGTVVSLTADSVLSKIFQAQHSRTVDRLDLLEAEFRDHTRERDAEISTIKDNFHTEQEVSMATERANAKYRNALRPWIDRLTIAVVVLILWNGRAIIEAFMRAVKP